MNKGSKETKSGFESFLRKKLSIGSDPVKYATALNNKMKKVAKTLCIEFDSLYSISDIRVLSSLKNALSTNSKLVYNRAKPVNKWEDGLKWYTEFLSEPISRNTPPIHVSATRSFGLEEGEHIAREQNVISRNRQARDECIQIHGCKCAACQLTMSDLYGEIGEGFIEVHHLKPIHLFDDAHTVDPKEDLIPLCPNCHAMIHKLDDVSDLSRLIEIIRKHNSH